MTPTRAPNALYLFCEECGEETLHQVLRGRVVGKKETLEATVRCPSCQRTRKETLRPEPTVEVPFIISNMGESERRFVEMGADELLRAGEDMMLPDQRIMITSLEAGDRRLAEAKAGEVDTVWAKNFDRVLVKVSVNLGRKTRAESLWADPEEEFAIGDLLEFGRFTYVVDSIKIEGQKVRRGSVQARDIVRVYAKPVR